MILGALVFVGAVGTVALALDDGTILTGIQQSTQHNRRGENLVLKSVNVPFVPAPGPEPDDPPRKQAPMSVVLDGGKSGAPGIGDEAGISVGGVSLTAVASPQTQLEMSLKDLARELR